MKAFEYAKFHSRILVRGGIALFAIFVATIKVVDYRDDLNKSNTYEGLARSFTQMSQEVSSLENGADLRKWVEADSRRSIETFFNNPTSYEYNRLQKLLIKPDERKFQLESDYVNDQLGTVLGTYQQVYDVLFERKYRQRHRIKEIYYTLLDKLPLRPNQFVETIDAEIKGMASYREYILDSGVRMSYKNRADKYVGDALEQLTKLKKKVRSTGEFAKNDHWSGVLTPLRTELLKNSAALMKAQYTHQRSTYYSLLLQLVLIFSLGILGVTFLKNQKDYGLVKLKNKRIKKLKTERDSIKFKKDMLKIFKDTTDLPLALVNDENEIVWMNAGFDQVFNEGFLNDNNWERIRQRMVISSTAKTGIKNSVKIKGRGGEDFILRSHVFTSGKSKYRLLKLLEATTQMVTAEVEPAGNAFNPIELVEFIVEKLGTWSNIYDFHIEESDKFAALYEMDEAVLKTEMGALVASVIYFTKANNMKPRFVFDIDTGHDGFTFKIKLENVHLRSEEIGTSIELNGKRYVPLIDSFSKVEDSLRDYDGRVIIKNLTSAKNGKYAEIGLMVQERPLYKKNFEVAFNERGGNP